MNDQAYNQVKKFILRLPMNRLISIDSIPKLTDKSRERFIEICKKIIDDNDYNELPVFLEFSNDYKAIRLCTDYFLFNKQLKQKKWD